jgi:hypothetical protein
MYWWVAVVIVLCAVSLAIDAVDVLRYVRGERAPAVVLKGQRSGEECAGL